MPQLAHASGQVVFLRTRNACNQLLDPQVRSCNSPAPTFESTGQLARKKESLGLLVVSKRLPAKGWLRVLAGWLASWLQSEDENVQNWSKSDPKVQLPHHCDSHQT